MRVTFIALCFIGFPAPASAIISIPGNLGYWGTPWRIDGLRAAAARCKAREKRFELLDRQKAELWLEANPQTERQAYRCVKLAARSFKLKGIEYPLGVREI